VVLLSIVLGWRRSWWVGFTYFVLSGAVLSWIYAVGISNWRTELEEQHGGKAAFVTVGIVLYSYAAVAIAGIVFLWLISHRKGKKGHH
jgi:hypothetical protein